MTTKIGKVEWFDNKRGFGFITYSLGTDESDQVFVHITNLSVANDNVYKTLFAGEYVEFVLSEYEETDKKGKFQATKVTGVNGGALMCETRQLNRDSRKTWQTQKRNNTTNVASEH
jgi:cold shock CspA family protein